MRSTVIRRPLLFSSLLLILVLCAACGGGNMSVNMQSQGCSACSFVYSTTNTGEILTFPVSRMTGSLGTPTSVEGPTNSAGIVTLWPANSAQTYMYVSDPENSAVRVYSVSSANGTLSPASVGPYSLGNSIGTPGEFAALNPALYVAGSAGSIAAFTANMDGSLSPVPGSPFAAGAGLSHLFGATNGLFLYAANTGDANGSISAFSVGSNGALTPVPGSPFATVPGGGPEGFFQSGKVLYAALKNANAVAAFTINNDGSLTSIAGSPFPAGRGTFALNGAGGFLFATNNLDGTISSYNIDPSTGALAQVAGSPFAGAVSSGDTVYSAGSVLFVPDAATNTIAGFAANPTTGVVGPFAGSPFQAGTSPLTLTLEVFPAIDPPGGN
jgi:6-phosphogluconolactonase